jgi:hypothetical protein
LEASDLHDYEEFTDELFYFTGTLECQWSSFIAYEKSGSIFPLFYQQPLHSTKGVPNGRAISQITSEQNNIDNTFCNSDKHYFSLKLKL